MSDDFNELKRLFDETVARHMEQSRIHNKSIAESVVIANLLAGHSTGVAASILEEVGRHVYLASKVSRFSGRTREAATEISTPYLSALSLLF